ncbi:GNAT family N-acetyltransferase [Paenibacillus polymyxa]|uniref:Pseudaminic acid biosynthesis N-acetyl transferase n=1 Tax=Paenibacillus polymyxa TaxID=1406 RepID=A0A378Y5J5_PAEPO|nr:GNAT family N-acetyltransferase [Paenibacillus polymyxa]MBE7898985.1 GNAT family N-acetyltransferase [Paenibacillus polymyxa]MCC3259794.1 GNAT family N-acetyltransferase [Paenibacillus polymyxa]QPK53175.1 GNAT family N-acetyltransferase [Paenibacillus polymyxa]QPK58255.1 GNAT family N-acetyltransferase [Paenibacillus polymyxa]UOD86229.1 N-acetyltransferase [Paenibacillus polymyxa ATCC 842]
MELRSAALNDSIFIFNLRNDLDTRKNSFVTDEIPYEEHKNWFEKSLGIKTRKILIAYENKVLVGVVRLDLKSDNEAVISISIDPSLRQKGYANKILCEIESYTTSWNNEIKVLTALIKPSNIASIKLFSKRGYAVVSENKEEIIMCKELRGKYLD